MNNIEEILRALAPKLTRWDCISLFIVAVLAWVTVKGFALLSDAFRELLILIGVLFAMAIILCILEPALKRLWSKKR